MEENLNTSMLILGCVFVPGDTVLCDCLRYCNNRCSYQRLLSLQQEKTGPNICWLFVCHCLYMVY